MLARTLAVTSSLALAATLAAQVPLGHFVVSSRSPGGGSAATFVDSVTGDLTPVTGLTATVGELQTVTIDPVSGALYVSGLLSAVNSMMLYQVPMTGRNAGVPTRIAWTQARGLIADALIVPGGNVLLVVGGANTGGAGLWLGPVGGGVAVQLGSLSDGVEVAADAGAAYVLTQKTGNLSTIWKYDFVTSTFTQAVGGLPESKALDLFPPASQKLLVGSRSGDLYLADASSSQFALFRPVGQGPIAALRASASGDVLFATDSGALFTFGSLPNSLAQLGRLPTDIDIGTTNAASFFTFAGGCAGGGTFVPAMGATGLPALGNAGFAFAVSSGPGGAPAIFALGNNRRDWNGIPLPFDLAGVGAPGCTIAAKGIVLVPLALSGSGPGSGSGTVPLPIPNQMALVGAKLMAQWWILDPPANALGLIVSDGGEAIVR